MTKYVICYVRKGVETYNSETGVIDEVEIPEELNLANLQTLLAELEVLKGYELPDDRIKRLASMARFKLTDPFAGGY